MFRKCTYATQGWDYSHAGLARWWDNIFKVRKVYLFFLGQVLNGGGSGLDGVVLRSSTVSIVATIGFLLVRVGNLSTFLIGIISKLLGALSI